jgi:plastocyanin
MLRFWPLLLAVAAGLLVGSWSVAQPKAASVNIRTFQFQPTPLVVKPGTRIVWTNQDEIRHTVASGTAGARDGRFGGALADRGATYDVALGTPGSYPYFCERHPSMRGEIRVE